MTPAHKRAQSKKYIFEPLKKRERSLSCKRRYPPKRPTIRPIYCIRERFFLKIIAISKKVIIGLKVVMITLPAPAKPYFTPRKEKTIKAIFKTELLAIYLTAPLLRVKGFFKK